MKQKNIVVAACLMLSGCLSFSCIHTSQDPLVQNPTFFNLTTYFNKEIDKLEQSPLQKVHKKVEIGGAKEEKIMEIKNWRSELSPFLSSSIHRPSYADKYTVDSIFGKENQLAELRYETLDKKLKTHKLDIKFTEEANIHSIVIVNYNKNDLYGAHEILEYIPRQRYSILKTQAVILLEESTYKIDGFWMKE